MLGGSIFEVFILPSILKGIKKDPRDRIQSKIRSVNLYTPINFVMLIAIIFTGIFLLFSLYERVSNIASPLYLNVFFIKIILVSIIFAIATFQTFYLRFKIAILNVEKIKDENLPNSFHIMQTCSKINIILITVALFLGITMSGLG